jgi:mannose/fructose/N-acetylgalactosamine-specific phosphotransferase system component IIC
LGQAFAWIFIACGFFMMFGLRVPFLGTGIMGGLWLALIGWFLNNAAMGHRQRGALWFRRHRHPEHLT